MNDNTKCDACGEPRIYLGGKEQPHMIPGSKTVSGNQCVCPMLLNFEQPTPTVEANLKAALELLLIAYQLKQLRDHKGCDLINAAVNETTLALRKERNLMDLLHQELTYPLPR